MKFRTVTIIACLCAALGACAEAPKEAPVVALPAAPPPGEPAWISGMDMQALRATFGQPVFERKDGTAQMWRYENASCKAFFFLYAGNNGTTVVHHVETVPRGREMAADESCLAQLRVRPNGPTS